MKMLTIPQGSDIFISEVLSNKTSLNSESPFLKHKLNTKRKERLTENNLIIGSSIIKTGNTQKFLDEDFSQLKSNLKWLVMFNEVLRRNNQNIDNKVEISGIIPSCRIRDKLHQHLLLNNGNVAKYLRTAIPYGSSNYIPLQNICRRIK